MNSTKSFISQCLLWLVIWLLLWSGQSWDEHFLNGNLHAFGLQIVLVGVLIFYTAPTFLFNKKYAAFILISLLLLLLFSYIASHIAVREMPKPPPFRPLKRGPPPRFFTHSLLLFMAYILATVVQFVIYTQKKDEEIIRSKNENLQTELKLLKSQINPHFLFNSLNNIYALSAIDTSKTQQSISYLSDMLRYVLYECERPFVMLQNEIDYIENYLKLFSLKSSQKYPIDFKFQVSKTSVKIAPMLLIPFVENALKHSHIENINDSFIHIDLYADDSLILFKISNKIASKNMAKDEVGGIGLENVKRRLSLLYPENHSLFISEIEGIFKVELSLKNHV